jgi:serine/threonine protein kinase
MHYGCRNAVILVSFSALTVLLGNSVQERRAKAIAAKAGNRCRHAAIKALSHEFGQDAKRLACFQREGEVLSSLNHPNIATLCGLEESDGKRFIVMELGLEETVALPIDNALRACGQIAGCV